MKVLFLTFRKDLPKHIKTFYHMRMVGVKADVLKSRNSKFHSKIER